ncbi:AAA family ATPase [Xylophilus ampelinus]|uniref:Putative ATP-binding protein involved in virulence n=1 Tax=Xylophilus ampelinus TaxID=54067 RepID=A0A318SF98_9BURK|nr:AAA family ATPase [Xylophilus ampelinus]MCS4510814.1 AAA family ATPase [Xylophilus ampelinus]PYE76207.1 putative ATP-binding protein involved in virulence [Xylophilus ampelinus]
MLNKITIEGLRGVGCVEMQFDPHKRVRTLFGSNGVGKTKCLEAIFQALLVTSRTFMDERHRSSISLSQGGFVMEGFTADGGIGFSLSTKTAASDVFFYSSTGVELAQPVHALPIVLLGARKRASFDSERAPSGLVGTFEQRQKAYFDTIERLFRDNRLGESGMSVDVAAWFVSRAQSVNPYQRDTDNLRAELDTVLELLNAVDNRIDSKRLEIDGAGRVFLMVEQRLRALDELSSGFASLVKLVQAIVSGYATWSGTSQLRDLHGIVLIDEIESHLHARWQVGIIPCLKRLLPNTTFFVATHSPLVLVQLQQGEAYLLQRDTDDVVRSSVIEAPDHKAFADVLDDALGVDLNALKRDAMAQEDQSAAKRRLLELLEKSRKAVP